MHPDQERYIQKVDFRRNVVLKMLYRINQDKQELEIWHNITSDMYARAFKFATVHP